MTRVAITGEVQGERQILAALKRMTPSQNDRITGPALIEMAQTVVRDAALNQIIRGGRFRGPAGPRGGKGKLMSRPAHASRLTSRTEMLRLSLTTFQDSIDKSGLPGYVEAGSNLVYAPVHEFGTNGTKRAFLAPALKAVQDQFDTIARKHWKREADL